MRKGLFVAGTDTEVGKTMVSAALLLALRKKGIDAGYFKPVGTEGIETKEGLINPDALLIKRLAGLDDSPKVMNPFCLRHALSPLAAARLEGVDLTREQIVASFEAAMAGHKFTLCEGAGGLLVPVAPGYTVLDLAADLDLPVLLVGKPGLGTINHILLSLKAIRQKWLQLIGYCFSGPETDAGTKGVGNSELIQEFSGLKFLGALPELGKDAQGELDSEELALAGEGLDLTTVL